MNATWVAKIFDLFQLAPMSKNREPLEIGADGWPTDPQHPCYRLQRARTAEQFHAEVLDALKRDGGLTALLQAVDWCRRRQLPLPDWAADRVLQLLTNPDRLAKQLSAARRDRVHRVRWDMVRELRDRRHELKISHPLPDGTKSEGYGATWGDAFANVASALAGTKSEGSPDAIKKSYQKIERALRTQDWGKK